MHKHPRIEIFKDVKGGFRFRVIAANDKIVAQSEGYTTKAMCEKGILALMSAVTKSSVVLCDLTK